MGKARGLRYIVVSPVKNEEAFVRETILSMIRQTERPIKWVIVDDNSTDGTPAVLEECCATQDWIEVIKNHSNTARGPGAPVIHAFNKGYETIRNEEWDLVVKLDCDLKFSEDYFSRILDHFEKDERLGIASGIYLEKQGDVWQRVEMPRYHAAGACKVIRRACFEAIGGFLPERGWDTLDEIRAQMKGWTTRHFRELEMQHLKPEGAGIGFVRTNMMHGEIYYRTGGGGLFFFLKFLHRIIFGRPILLGGMVMGYAYIKCIATRRVKIVNSDEAEFYRRLLNRRIFQRFSF